MSNSDNMDNFTALSTSYLCFTFGTNLMHAAPRAYRILVFFPALFSKFMLFEFQVKDDAGTFDHVQNTEASPGLIEFFSTSVLCTLSDWPSVCLSPGQHTRCWL